MKAVSKAVFIDRDNTLLDNRGDLGDPDQVHLLPGAALAIADLNTAGYLVVVVTNQGGVARGAFSEEAVRQVHQRVAELLRVEGGNRALVHRYYYCPYHPEGTVPAYRMEHPDRKPGPGMLLQASRDLALELGECWMIGDQWRDMEAGHAAGTHTMLLMEDHPDTMQTSLQPPPLHAADLAEAVQIILETPP